MYCRECGKQIDAKDGFCSRCGASQYAASVPLAGRRLVRPHVGRKIAGVALGFAHYFGVDVALMRILWVLLIVLTGGLGLVIYLAAWILMPPQEYLPAPADSPAPETSKQ
jgi:phage shock protein PspC (stress-responsive transcriptional regulator)